MATPIANRWEVELRERVKKQLRRRNWESRDLSRAAGLPPGYVHEWFVGRRAHTRVTMLKRFAEILEVPMENLLGNVATTTDAASGVPVKSIPVVGVVDSGSYRTDDPILDRQTILAPLYPGFHIDEHVAYQIADNAMDMAKSQGTSRCSVVICVKPRRAPTDGDVVIVEHTRHETTAVLMRHALTHGRRGLTLVAESSTPEKYPPIEVEDMDGSGAYKLVAFAYASLSFFAKNPM
jgi:hypothetical protein